MRVGWLILAVGLTACGSGSNDVVAVEVDSAVPIRRETTAAPDTTDSSTTDSTTTVIDDDLASSTTTATTVPAPTSTLTLTLPPNFSLGVPAGPPMPPDTSTGATSAPPSPSPTPSNATPADTSPVTTVPPATVPTPPAAPDDPIGLRIEAEYPSGYNRDLFRHWVDANGDGCDTRREVLIVESTTPVTIGSGCSITGGTWFSIYDNVTTIDSSSFDIDHVVALKEAWDSGAWNWTSAQRQAFANDLSQPFFLVAVSASSNRSKSDRDPAEWLPTNTSYRCDYARNWIAVKRAWDLSVDPAEHAALSQLLAAC